MTGFNARVEVSPDIATVAQHIAERMTSAALAKAKEGEFRVSLSGGSTPKALYTLLASDAFRNRFPWGHVHWYWGDERFVPHDHPDSNYRMACETMLNHAPVPPENIHPVPTDGEPETAAARYEALLKQTYGADALTPDWPLFDFTLLGIGEDGHTASLLPGQPVLEEQDRWVAAVPYGRPEVRITMTYPAIASSREVAFMATGADKAAVFQEICSGHSRVPAARVYSNGDLVWYVDRALAGER